MHVQCMCISISEYQYRVCLLITSMRNVVATFGDTPPCFLNCQEMTNFIAILRPIEMHRDFDENRQLIDNFFQKIAS